MTCCGRLWRNLGNHLRFAHGEEVVIPERESVPCFCGAPAVGYDFDLMGDGQVTNRQPRCVAHLVGLP